MRRTRACGWTLLALLSPFCLAQDFVPADDLREAGLIKYWQLKLPLGTGQHLADLYLVDDHLYATTNDGDVFALHADTGALRWLRPITREGYRVTRPVHVRDRVIFATPTTILQINRLNGEGLDRYELRFPAGTAPATDGVRLFLGGLDERMHTFNLANIYTGWQVIADGPISSTPVLFEEEASSRSGKSDVLFFASASGHVYSCEAANKALRWQTRTFGSISADLVVAEEGVYVAGREGSLYLLDLLFGETRWKARFSGPLYEAPNVTAGLAFQYCPDDGLVAVNTGQIDIDHRIRWKLRNGRRLLTTNEHNAFVLSQNESIIVANLESGDVSKRIPARGMTLADAALGTTAVYVASPDGRVFCARPRGTPPVTLADVRAALREGAPEEQPVIAAETAEDDGQMSRDEMLKSSRTGMPLGGRSKVSRNFGRGGNGDGN